MDRIIITKLAELNLDFREHFPLLFESEPTALFNDILPSFCCSSLPVQIARSNEIIRFRQNSYVSRICSEGAMRLLLLLHSFRGSEQTGYFRLSAGIDAEWNVRTLNHHGRDCIDKVEKNSFSKWWADHYNISVTLIGSGFTSKKRQSSQLVLFSKSETLPPRSLRLSRQEIAGSLNLSNYTIKQLN